MIFACSAPFLRNCVTKSNFLDFFKKKAKQRLWHLKIKIKIRELTAKRTTTEHSEVNHYTTLLQFFNLVQFHKSKISKTITKQILATSKVGDNGRARMKSAKFLPFQRVNTTTTIKI